MKTREQIRAEAKEQRLEFEKRVVELCSGGIRVTDICKKLETHSGRVNRILRRHNVSRKRKLTPCLNCEKEISRKNNLYCDLDCFQLFHTKKRLERGHCSPRTMKRVLIKLHGEKCMKCGWSEIHSTTGKVPIQINHIDGNYKNNLESNLELLCPNCHSLTSNFGNLNKGNGREWRRKQYQLDNLNRTPAQHNGSVLPS